MFVLVLHAHANRCSIVNEQTSHAIQQGMSVTQALSIFQICRRDPAQESSASVSLGRAIVCDLWAVKCVCSQGCRVQETQIMSSEWRGWEDQCKGELPVHRLARSRVIALYPSTDASVSSSLSVDVDIHSLFDREKNYMAGTHCGLHWLQPLRLRQASVTALNNRMPFANYSSHQMPTSSQHPVLKQSMVYHIIIIKRCLQMNQCKYIFTVIRSSLPFTK